MSTRFPRILALFVISAFLILVVSYVSVDRTFSSCTDAVRSELWSTSIPLLPEVIPHISYRPNKHPNDVDTSIRSGVLVEPTHGKVFQGRNDGSIKHHVYSYLPQSGYLGEDRIVFWVEVSGERYKIIKRIAVVENKDFENPDRYCSNLDLSLNTVLLVFALIFLSHLIPAADLLRRKAWSYFTAFILTQPILWAAAAGGGFLAAEVMGILSENDHFLFGFTTGMLLFTVLPFLYWHILIKWKRRNESA